MSHANVEDIYPLTPIQAGLLFHSAAEPHAGLYWTQFCLDIAGPLDPARFREAWRAIVARHPVLRTMLVWENRDQPLQVVRRDMRLDWTEVDWTTQPADALEPAFSEWLARDRAAGCDLRRGPLVRFALFRLAADRARFVWSSHHAIMDGWSLFLVLGEALDAYDRLTRGEPLTLAPAPLFRRYVDWRAQQSWAGADAHFREQLAGVSAPTPLPDDHVHGEGEPFGTERVGLDEAETAALAAFARAQRVTVNTVMQAAWGLLLSRYAAEPAVIFGVVMSGREAPVPGIEGTAGLFINTLPVCHRIDPRQTVASWLAEVQRLQGGLLHHQHVPLADVHAWSEIPRNQPLFESIFAFENYPIADGWDQRPSGIRLENPRAFERSNFPLTATVGFSSRGDIVLHYDARRFTRETVQRLLRHYGELVRGMVAAPQARLADVTMLPAAERETILREWSRGRRTPERPYTLHALCEQQAARTPEATAIIAGDRRVSYRELHERADRLARQLAQRGAGPGVLVGLFMERTPAMLTGMLGILKSGAAYVPLDPAYPAARLAAILEDSQAPLVVTERALVGQLPAFNGRTICLDRDGAAIDAAIVLDASGVHTAAGETAATSTAATPAPATATAAAPAAGTATAATATAATPAIAATAAGMAASGASSTAVGDATPRDLAYVLFTSGSTGRPKGVAIEHRAAVNFVDWAHALFTPEELRAVLFSTSVCFDLSIFEIFATLTTGGAIVIVQHALQLPEAAARDEVTLINTVPSAIAELVRIDGIPRGVRTINLAGEALPGALVAEIQARCDGRVRINNLYGPTETTTYSTFTPVTASAPVTIGRPIDNTDVYVLDEARQPVPVGVSGELYIAGRGVARGYYGRPELTQERFFDDPFALEPGQRMYRTGDRCRWLPDGTLDYQGRLDHQVKIRGFRIELGEIEAVLGRHPAVRACAVIAREDTPGDPRIVAYLAVDPAGEEPDFRDLVARALPAYMVPSAFVRLERLPLTPNGKLDRKALPLPAAAAGAARAASGATAPRTDVERAIADIWSEILKVDAVGVEDDFFALGGHSLLAIRVLARIRQAFGVELSTRTFFRQSTVGDLARAVASADRGSQQPIRRVPAPVAPLSFGQERQYWLDRLTPGSAAYNMADAFLLDGPRASDPEILARACRALIERHESLRTAFRAGEEGEPAQVVLPAFDVPVALVDLRAATEDERERLWRAHAGADLARPFDLAAPPLFRVTLVRWSGTQQFVFLTLHHIVADEWSVPVLRRDLRALHAAAATGAAANLPELPVQYADIARWQRERVQGEFLQRQLEYWKRELAGMPTVLDLPTDRPRPSVQRDAGATVAFTLPASLVEAFKALARQERTTPFMAFGAAFMALMHRHSGQDDLIVGTPVSGRTRVEMEHLIGFFLNTVPLCARFGARPTFRELVRQVRDTALAAYGHSEVPFEKLVSEIVATRDRSRTPLVQVLFVLHDRHGVTETQPAPGGHGLHNGTAKFDLSLFLTETEQGISGVWEFKTDLFDESTLRRMSTHFAQLLASVTAAPDTRIDDVPLLDERERQLVLEEWNRTTPPASGGTGELSAEAAAQDRAGAPGTLVELFEAQVRRTPENVAIEHNGERLTYDELNRRANQIAHVLRRRGVGPDRLVGLFLHRSANLLASVLGILKAGGAYVPLDPAYPRERMSAILDDAGAAIVVTEQALAAALPERAFDRLVLDAEAEARALAGESDENPAPLAGPSHLAYVLFTSGSTGRPKGVAIEHRASATFVEWARGLFTPPELSGVLFATSICFDLSIFEIFVTLASGGTVIVATNVLHLPALPARESVTLINTVPSAMAALLLVSGVPRSVRTLNLAGEALQPALARQIYAETTVQRLYNLYGPTETTTYSTFTLVPRDGTVTVGRPITGTRVYVLDSRMQPQPIGVPGELYIGGAGVARGYYGRPDLTSERFVHDPFAPPGTGGQAEPRMYRTGDRCRWRADGTLEYLGRLDHQVKIRGLRIELGEIESVLAFHPAVHQCVVIARQDAPEGDAAEPLAGPHADARLVAYIEPVAGAAADVDDIRAHVARSVPAYMVPSAFVLLDKLPLTPNGKIDRKALPAPPRAVASAAIDAGVARAAQGAASADQHTPIATQTETEMALAAIWQELLKLPRVAAGDNFFTLGGHSLLAMRLVHRVAQRFGVALGPAALFEYPVLSALAAHIDRERAQQAPPAASTQAATHAQATMQEQRTREERTETPEQRASRTPNATPARNVAPLHGAARTTEDAVETTAPTTAPLLSVPATSAASAASAPREQVLVRLEPGGSGTPFFWVHGIGGEVFSYLQLSRHLGRSRPVYGFTADWSRLSNGAPVTLEQMAARYVREMRAVQPEGPYHLGGFCAAAMLALEMARQLEAAGHTVGVLAAIDYNAMPDSPSGLGALFAFLRNVPRWLAEDALPSGPKELWGRARSRMNRLRSRFAARAGGSSANGSPPAARGDLRDELGMWLFPDHQLPMLQLHHQALRNYAPKPVRGEISLYLPRTSPLFGPWPTSYDRSWDELSHTGIRTRSVRGSHSTMLTDPFAADLAAALDENIEAAEARLASSREREAAGVGR